jgi:hypothetical protein
MSYVYDMGEKISRCAARRLRHCDKAEYRDDDHDNDEKKWWKQFDPLMMHVIHFHGTEFGSK